MSFNKGDVFSKEISPLVNEILEISKREKIPMFFASGLRDEEGDGYAYYSVVLDHTIDTDVPNVDLIERCKTILRHE
jgi:hypothetical protein